VHPAEFFVGVDERFELMAAPGLVSSMEHGQRLAARPRSAQADAWLGADKWTARRRTVHGTRRRR